jgi:outer membrane lipoprotein-sorting protein
MRILSAALCLLASISAARSQDVNAILARMDRAAPTFHAMSADVQMKTFTAIIGDTTMESGTLKMQRLKNAGLRAVLDFSGQTDAREIAFLGKIVRIYYPNLKTYQDYDVGKNTDVLNQFLLLGFGSSGKELAQSYDITPEGSEKIAGRDTTKLLLVPRDQKIKDHLSKIEICIPEDAPYPVQQQFFEPSGNYRIVTYTNIKINPPIKGTLELKLPSGAKKQG